MSWTRSRKQGLRTQVKDKNVKNVLQYSTWVNGTSTHWQCPWSNVPPYRNTHRGPTEELQQVSGGVHLSAEGYWGGSWWLHRRCVGLHSGPHRPEGKTPVAVHQTENLHNSVTQFKLVSFPSQYFVLSFSFFHMSSHPYWS